MHFQTYRDPFNAFNGQLAILQQIATTAQVRKHGAKTVGWHQLIDSVMPIHGWSAKLTPDVHGQHEQRATATDFCQLLHCPAHSRHKFYYIIFQHEIFRTNIVLKHYLCPKS
jgi:hypothetical protein